MSLERGAGLGVEMPVGCHQMNAVSCCQGLPVPVAQTCTYVCCGSFTGLVSFRRLSNWGCQGLPPAPLLQNVLITFAKILQEGK